MAKSNSTRARACRRYVNRPPEDIDEQNGLANEMLEWVHKTDSLVLEEFPISKNMAPSRFYQCAENNEYFADALDLARYIMSSRLQQGLRRKELDKDSVLRLLPLYNQEYRALIIDKVRPSQEAQNKTITVVLEKVPDSQLVPLKIESK